MPTSIYNSRGVTLIELITVIVVLGIVGLMGVSFLGNSMQAYIHIKERDQLYDEGRLALERVIREIRVADSIGTITTGASAAISFTKPASAVSPNDNSTAITFRLNGTQLRREANNAPTTVLTDRVSLVHPGGQPGDDQPGTGPDQSERRDGQNAIRRSAPERNLKNENLAPDQVFS